MENINKEEFIKSLKFDEKGLIPAIIVDSESKKVLTLAYMNKESLGISLDKGLTCFWSRSRQELWLKGETSGNYQHIVDIRQGQGTFLCAMPGLAHDPLGLRFADQEELIAQLLETRLLIEPSVAALAAVRRQDKQLVAMKNLLDKMDNAYLHGEDYTPYDFEFHSLIAQCTGNDVMKRLLPTIHESIQAGYHHTRRVEGSYQRASQCHLEMYRAIMEHDSARARQAAQRHMMQTMHDSGVEVPSVLVK